jgi:hypothetical protein
VVLLLLISPSASISLIPLVWYTGEAALLMTWIQEEETAIILWSMAAVCLAASMAFLLLMFELYIVSFTSSLSLNVIGTFKEMVTISAGVLLFGDQINATNGLGVVVTVIGIVGYNHQRYHKLQREAKAKALLARQRRQQQAVGGGGGGGGDVDVDVEGAAAAAGERSRLLSDDDDSGGSGAEE